MRNTAALLILLFILLPDCIRSQNASGHPALKPDHPELIRKDQEIETLRESLKEAQELLDSAAEELEKNRQLLEILRTERDAEIFQKSLRQRSESVMTERYLQEARLRELKEQDFIRLRGNLLFPGAGQIYLSESRGYLWAGLFTVFLGTAVWKNQEVNQKRKAMQAASVNPFLFERSRAEYLKAYNEYTYTAFTAASVYAASAADAAFVANSETRLSERNIRLTYSVRF